MWRAENMLKSHDAQISHGSSSGRPHTPSTDAIQNNPRGRYKIKKTKEAMDRKVNGIELERKEAQAKKEKREEDLQRFQELTEEAREEFVASELQVAHTALNLTQLLNMETHTFVSEAPKNVTQYKHEMDRLAMTYPYLTETSAWKKSIAAYGTFLLRIVTMLRTMTDDIVKGEQSSDNVLQIKKLLTDNGEWTMHIEADPSYINERDEAIREADVAIKLMSSAPDHEVERALWRQDLNEVILAAQRTEVTGLREMVEEFRTYRTERKRSKMEPQEMVEALVQPELPVHMDVIRSVVITEMDRLKEEIVKQKLRPGDAIWEVMNFGKFALGRATVKYTISKARDETTQRQSLSIKWYRINAMLPIQMKMELGKMSPYLHMSDHCIRSERELVRFLYWLDTTLTPEQRVNAETWDKLNPFDELTTPTIEYSPRGE